MVLDVVLGQLKKKKGIRNDKKGKTVAKLRTTFFACSRPKISLPLNDDSKGQTNK